MSYGKRSLSYACTQCRTYYVAPYYDLIVDAEGVHDPIRLGCRFAVDLRRLEAARARGSKRRLVEQFVAGGLIDLHRDDIALRLISPIILSCGACALREALDERRRQDYLQGPHLLNPLTQLREFRAVPPGSPSTP